MQTSVSLSGNRNNSTAQVLLELLRRDGMLRTGNTTLTPLTDGVSSEIYRVDDGDNTFVVKRALQQLKVKESWFADVSRNHYEQLYITYVGAFLPQSVPRLLSGDNHRDYFVMEFFGSEYKNWKRLLLEGKTTLHQATQAGELLGRIHAHSAGDHEAERLFDTKQNFTQLRIEPYLLTTGSRHPDLRTIFEAEAERLALTRQCLVHGDFSPKNILISPARMVLLDCEVAWYGEPAFDVAFLLTHLLLKALYHSSRQTNLAAMSYSFWQRYADQARTAFDPQVVAMRVARLLLMLLLARIDGKSPVEYLTQRQQADWVRQFTRARIPASQCDLREILGEWFLGLSRQGTQL